MIRPLAFCLALTGSTLALAADDLARARRDGWDLAKVAVDLLRKGEPLPGITAWLQDYAAVETQVAAVKRDAALPAVDVEKLVTRNPNFWAMYFEISPGDPALALLHAGLLLAGGEAPRAMQLTALAKQRPGIDAIMEQALLTIGLKASEAQRRSNEIVEAGIRRHDAADLAGALAKYDEALALLPANGWAHYERGFSLHGQALQVAGQPLPGNDAITIGHPVELPAPVAAAYAQARFHDPFQWQAWQGSEAAIVAGARALFVKAQPVWNEIRRDASKRVGNDQLADLAEACRRAQIDDYALSLRQIVAARRREYRPADRAAVAESLRRLVPGPAAEATIRKIESGEAYSVRQLAPIDEP